MPLSEKLTNLTNARLAHEAIHGKPDQYNGISLNEDNGKRLRLHAYTPEWWESYARWMKAWDQAFSKSSI